MTLIREDEPITSAHLIEHVQRAIAARVEQLPVVAIPIEACKPTVWCIPRNTVLRAIEGGENE